MGQEPADLRRDIERRREELGETIDAIGDRVSPGRMIERRRNRMTGGMRSMRDRIMGTVGSGTDAVMGTMSQGTERVGDAAGSLREHLGPDAVRQQAAGSPLGAGMVAFGIGFLLAATLPPSEVETEAAHKAQDALGPAKDALMDSARSVAEDVKEGAAEAAQEVKSTATEVAGDVAATAKEHAAATKDDAQRITSS